MFNVTSRALKLSQKIGSLLKPTFGVTGNTAMLDKHVLHVHRQHLTLICHLTKQKGNWDELTPTETSWTLTQCTRNREKIGQKLTGASPITTSEHDRTGSGLSSLLGFKRRMRLNIMHIMYCKILKITPMAYNSHLCILMGYISTCFNLR